MNTATARTVCAVLAVSMACACGGASSQAGAATTVAAEAEPVGPPSDPLGWLPADSAVVARLDLEGWRNGPLADQVAKLDEAGDDLIALQKVQRAYVGLTPKGTDDFSVAAVLEGDFGAGYLAARAAEKGLAARPYGDTNVYTYEGSEWFQVDDSLLVAGTPDRLDWLLSRQQAVDAPLRDTAFFQGLAPAVQFDTSHVAVLFEDRDGTAKQALAESGSGQASRAARALESVVRGAVRVQVDDGIAVAVVADSDTAEHAAQLEGLLQRYLDAGRASPFLALLGLRDVLASLSINREAQRVALRGGLSQQQLDDLIARLEPMIQNLLDAGLEGEPLQMPQGGVAPEQPLAPAQ